MQFVLMMPLPELKPLLQDQTLSVVMSDFLALCDGTCVIELICDRTCVNVNDGFYPGVNVCCCDEIVWIISVILVTYWSSLNARVVSNGL
jgi:hypothetical protein